MGPRYRRSKIRFSGQWWEICMNLYYQTESIYKLLHTRRVRSRGHGHLSTSRTSDVAAIRTHQSRVNSVDKWPRYEFWKSFSTIFRRFDVYFLHSTSGDLDVDLDPVIRSRMTLTFDLGWPRPQSWRSLVPTHPRIRLPVQSRSRVLCTLLQFDLGNNDLDPVIRPRMTFTFDLGWPWPSTTSDPTYRRLSMESRSLAYIVYIVDIGPRVTLTLTLIYDIWRPWPSRSTLRGLPATRTRAGIWRVTRKANTRIAMFRRLACIMIGTRLLHRHGLRSTYYDLRPTAQSNNLGWKQVETGMPVRNRSIAGMTDGNQPLAVIPTHGIRMPSANSAFSTKPTGNNAKMRHKFH
jgi:hypothetical protein